MFFATYVLTEKGPLAKVWLAAHWDRRLTRNEVKVMDLSKTIMYIVHPVVPIALRTSGELLVGVVRIYVLKVKHLLKEATEATLFLRVTTATAKGNSAAGASLSVGADDKTTSASIDGLLVPNKGDLEAVTFDWSKEMAGRHGSLPEAAAALSESRFDAIADLLGAQRVEGMHSDDGLLASAWYAVEPGSQAVEELHSAQQDYNEMDRVQRNLMAFGERASGSSASKSKSSLSSIEKGRGSAAEANGIDGEVPFPPVTDDLDIGMPIPDELASNIPLLGTQQQQTADGQLLPEDPFMLPDMLAMEEEEAAALAHRPQERKPRPVNVLDLAATALPREVFEKCMNDRSDVLNTEPRRGPLDEQEERDRYTLTGTTAPCGTASSATSSAAASAAAADVLSIADAALLSSQPNPTLRAVFASVLQQQVAEAVEEVVRASEGSAPSGGRRSDLLSAAAGMPEELEADAALDEERAAEERAARKRTRQEMEGDDPHVLSASAARTLQRIRAEAGRVASNAARRRNPRATDAKPQDLVGVACTMKNVCTGLRRRDAARTFVDVLVLASKQLIGVHQIADGEEVQLRLREASVCAPVA